MNIVISKDQDGVDKLIRYGNSIAEEFNARLSRIRSFVPNHNLTSGTANETILRGFINEFLPKKYAAGQGFICDPVSLDGLVSRQCDILIYNQVDYPLVHNEGDVKVVWPESARLVIEVKTTLTKNSLKDALENIKSAKEINERSPVRISGVIFAFQSKISESAITSCVNEFRSNNPSSLAPNAIIILDNPFIFAVDKWEISLNDSDEYSIWNCSDPGTPITYFSLVIMHLTSPGLLGSTILNALMKLQERNS